eukprot:6986130-Prymnesium_polylepis.1
MGGINGIILEVLSTNPQGQIESCLVVLTSVAVAGPWPAALWTYRVQDVLLSKDGGHLEGCTNAKLPPALPPHPPPPPAPSPLQPFGTLNFDATLRTHAEAQAHCYSYGGKLVEIRNANQQQAVETTLSGVSEIFVWVGGIRGAAPPATWAWDDGSLMSI